MHVVAVAVMDTSASCVPPTHARKTESRQLGGVEDHFRLKGHAQNESVATRRTSHSQRISTARNLLYWWASAVDGIAAVSRPDWICCFPSSPRSAPASVTGVLRTGVAWTASLGGRGESRRRLAAATPPVPPVRKPRRA